MEAKLGVQLTVQAQRRSKEILKDIEQSKAQSGNASAAASANQTTGDRPQSYGTGVIISKDGIIITAAHDVKLGQPVFTIGFPDIQLQGFSPKMTQGEISSPREFKKWLSRTIWKFRLK